MAREKGRPTSLMEGLLNVLFYVNNKKISFLAYLKERSTSTKNTIPN